MDNDLFLKLVDLHYNLSPLHKKPLIVTGFDINNAKTHPILEYSNHYHLRKRIGGINYLFLKKDYELLKKSSADIKYWDDLVCNSKQFVLASHTPSLIQHIGNHGMNATPDNFVRTHSFHYKYLIIYLSTESLTLSMEDSTLIIAKPDINLSLDGPIEIYLSKQPEEILQQIQNKTITSLPFKFYHYYVLTSTIIPLIIQNKLQYI